MYGSVSWAGPAREQLFDAAVTAFADHTALGGGVDTSCIERPALEKEGFGLTLAVQVAALVAVLRTRGVRTGRDESINASRGNADPAAMTRELLIREVDHWRKMQGRAPDPVTVSSQGMARAAFVATLTRGMPAGKAVPLLDALGLGADSQTVIDQHSWCYPPSTRGRVLEPLYPDRLVRISSPRWSARWRGRRLGGGRGIWPTSCAATPGAFSA